MTNKIATVEETNEEAEDGGMIIREAEDYFDKVFAVESKELKFFFDDDEDVNDHMMYAYCLQGKFEFEISKGLINLVMIDSDNWDKTAHAKSYIVDTAPKCVEYLFEKDSCSSFLIKCCLKIS